MTANQRIKQIKQREEYQIAANDEITAEIKKLKEIEHAELYGYPIDYHTPAGANWCYRIELVMFNGRTYEVVKSFGRIIHACYTSLYNYEG